MDFVGLLDDGSPRQGSLPQISENLRHLETEGASVTDDDRAPA